MAEMANPKKIIDGYKQTSYFGLPPRLARYETDPQKLGADGSLTGALKGLLRGGAGAAGNMGVGLYNAVAKTGTPTTTSAERTAAFAAQSTARYRDPLAPAPENKFSEHLGNDIAAMDTKLLPAHTPGQRLLRTAAPTPQAAPAVAKRPSLRTAPAERPLPANTPTVSWAPPEEAAPVEERGYIESDGTRYYIPGSKAYDGVGSTGAPQFENAPVVVPQPGTPGYAGSQAEWEANQVLEQRAGLARRFGVPLMRALTESSQLDETARNNQAVNARELLKAESEVGAREALLPGQVEQQDLTAEKSRLENRFYPAVTAADVAYKGGLTRYANVNADTKLAEAPADAELKGAQAGYYRKLAEVAGAKDDTALLKLQMEAEIEREKLKARNDSPLAKADAEAAAAIAPAVGLTPTEVAAGMKAGYRTPQKAKSRWFRPDQKAGLVNAAGEVYDPAAPALPAGYKLSGKFTPDGRPILVDAQGKKFVQ